jgi:putative peptidoglycan lipid II flippase
LPTLYGSLAVFVSLPVYYLGMRTLGASGIGIAIAFSAVAQVLFIYMIWNRQSANRESAGVYGFYLKTILAAVPLYLVLRGGRYLLLAGLAPGTLAGSLLTVAVVGGLGCILMVAAGRLAGIEEMNAVLGMIRRRAR